ncbi:dimethylamine monooxygenase subunit DmmA family protein [Blastococcus deserti]|uniref:Dimethylamine monooxygenase subunit DmmA family protein n=1 Tax=Blastococcus deserti TaxID=2259033 RepID=A0ABW4X792_9ACTN
MGAQHASVPRWTDERPHIDPSARAVALVEFGPSGAAAVRGWAAVVPDGVPARTHLAPAADEDTRALLAEQIAAARVGWRLVLAGPEIEVLAARALATGLGVLDAEISVAVTDAQRKRVFCPHCRTTTTTEEPVGGSVPCDGCGRRLFVYAHVSRRAGAYLGFMADAEEAA